MSVDVLKIANDVNGGSDAIRCSLAGIPKTIFRRHDRDGWYTSWSDPISKRKYNRQIGLTYAEAKLVLANIRNSILSGTVSGGYLRCTLNEFVSSHRTVSYPNKWSGPGDSDISFETYKKERQHISNYIIPYLGEMFMFQITPHVATSFAKRLWAAGKKEHYIRNICSTLFRILRDGDGICYFAYPCYRFSAQECVDNAILPKSVLLSRQAEKDRVKKEKQATLPTWNSHYDRDSTRRRRAAAKAQKPQSARELHNAA